MGMRGGLFRQGGENSDIYHQSDGGDILSLFDARFAHRPTERLLPAAFSLCRYKQKGNDHLTIMK